MIYSLSKAVLGDEESKNRALTQLSKDLSGVGREFIPWYQQTMYLLETALGTEYVDSAFIRKFMGMIKESYTPAEAKEVERNWFEKFQHALFGGASSATVAPTEIEAGLKTLSDAEDMLGKLDNKGNVFTLSDYASKVRAVEKTVPDDIMSDMYGFSELTLFYIDCEAYFQKEYDDKYAGYSAYDKGRLRRAAREQNPNLDALLYFWGVTDTLLSTEARDIVLSLYDYYGIPAGARW
jgi:hypothetical protein